MDIAGRIWKIMPEVSGESRNGSWKKQEFVIETADQYPKKVCCTVWGDKVDELSNYKTGDQVRAYINIESREYNDRWYTDVKAWKLEPLDAAAPKPVENESADTPDAYPPLSEDDLPF